MKTNQYTNPKPDDIPGCPANAALTSAESPGREQTPRDDDADENLMVGCTSIEGEYRDSGARPEVSEGEVLGAGEILGDEKVCDVPVPADAARCSAVHHYWTWCDGRYPNRL